MAAMVADRRPQWRGAALPSATAPVQLPPPRVLSSAGPSHRPRLTFFAQLHFLSVLWSTRTPCWRGSCRFADCPFSWHCQTGGRGRRGRWQCRPAARGAWRSPASRSPTCPTSCCSASCCPPRPTWTCCAGSPPARESRRSFGQSSVDSTRRGPSVHAVGRRAGAAETGA